ncbi:MAG: hypothetical protein M1823_001851 [Watsoniomyces obsoletus]|nr:MAG: hypothetical protein M1823_001851 [Watsoniomyces obsoletus]
MNISGTFSIFRLLRDPSVCLPHHTIPTFQHLPLSLSQTLSEKYQRKIDIRAIVLDKDNCFARAGENDVYKPYEDHFNALRDKYPGAKLLIVSNSAGTRTSDLGYRDATDIENTTGVHVLRHSTKKPGAYTSVMDYFLHQTPSAGVTHASQIAVVGDRLFTDVMMANMMGSWAVWVRDGVEKDSSLFARFERRLEPYLRDKGYQESIPMSHFEG